MFPLVSIGIPTYNRKNFLLEALNSVVSQDYPNIEIIISDNHSDDGTEELINNYLSTYKKKNISYYRQPSNFGPKKNWENCISSAHGDFMLMLSDDDILEPDAISNLVKAVSDDVVLVIGNKTFIDNEGNPFKEQSDKSNKYDRYYVYTDKVGKTLLDIKNNDCSYDCDLFWRKRLSGVIHDTPSAVLFRRDLGERIFKNVDKAGSAIDLAMDLFLSTHGIVKTISNRVVGYRMHSGNDSNNIYRCASSHVGLYELMVDNNFDKRKISLLRSYCMSVIYHYAILALKANNYRLCYKCLDLLFTSPLCINKCFSFFILFNKLVRSTIKYFARIIHLSEL